MGVEGIYFEDDRDTYYAGSVIMAPPSYKSRPNSVIYVNNQGIYSEPIVLGNGDTSCKYKYGVCECVCVCVCVFKTSVFTTSMKPAYSESWQRYVHSHYFVHNKPPTTTPTCPPTPPINST